MAHLRWLFVALLLSGGAGAVPTEIAGTVVEEDGQTPVAAAQVTVRVLVGQGVGDTVVETAADGTFQATVDIPDPDSQPRLHAMRAVMLLVRADEHAIGVGLPSQQALKLYPAFDVEGRVMGALGPVPNAQVTVHTIDLPMVPNSLTLHDPEAGLAFPEGLTTSGPDGTFHLPGLMPLGQRGLGGVTLAVLACGDEAGQPMVGSSSQFRVAPPRPDGMRPPPMLFTIPMQKATTVRGLVVDDRDEPLAGATVRLYGRLAARVVPPVVTGGDGRYELRGAPQDDLLRVVGSLDGYAMAWERSPASRQTELTAPTLVLRRLVPVSGRVIDPVTGAPPPPPMAVICRYGPEMGGEDMLANSLYTRTETAADGTFTLPVPPGPASLLASGPGYRTEQPIGDVPAAGLTGVELSVERRRGVLLHFVTEHPDGVRGVQLSYRESPTGRRLDTGTLDRAWWFWSLRPGQTSLIVQAERFTGKELLVVMPPRVCNPDEDPWPLEVKID